MAADFSQLRPESAWGRRSEHSAAPAHISSLTRSQFTATAGYLREGRKCHL